VLFSLASIGCAFAPSLPWLLLGRTFQGLGGAAIMSVQPALVRAIYPRNMLGRGLGFNTTVVATLARRRPVDRCRAALDHFVPILFAVYAPLGIISFVLSERYLPHTTHTHRPFDVISAIMSGLTFGLLIFGIDGMAHGHQRPVIATELILAIVLGTMFVWRQKTLADPMMPIDVFKRPIFSLSITAAMCTFSRRAWPSSACPFYFHTVLGRSASDTGILLTAWPLALASVAPIAGRLADRHHAGVLGAIGLTFMTTGLVLTALLPADPSSANIMWRLVLCGAGFGIFASPNNRLMMNAVPRERSGSAGGIIATARTLGQTVGAALVALVFSLFDFSSGGAVDAARAAIWLAAGFAATALVVGSLRLRH